MSQALTSRPSDILFVSDEWAAFCLDRSVYAFGASLQGELDAVEEKNDKTGKKAQTKKDRILRKWIPEMNKASTPAFKDPGKR
jgi:hypothetical protein